MVPDRPHSPTPDQLARRVRGLERTRRFHAFLLLAGAILVFGAFRPWQSDVQDLIRARTVQIVDAEGQIRMELTHDSSGTRLYVHDDAGDVRVGVAQFAHGGGGFALHGPQGRGAAVLYLKGDGSLTFYDVAGAVTARFPSE